MVPSDAACPLCGCTQCGRYAVAPDRNWGFPVTVAYRRCPQCRIIFQHPMPEEEKLWGWYPEFYGSIASHSQEEIEKKVVTRANRERTRLLEKFCSPGRVFDVGCGSGFFLEYVRRLGWQVAGIDPAVEHVEFARNELGLADVSTGSWSADSTVPAGLDVDVFSFLHVIEHLVDPLGALKAVAGQLKIGGMVLIETPNSRSWPAGLFRSCWVTLDAPRHTIVFSPRGLALLLEKAGFEICTLGTYSPSTMEYSESIRYFLADRGLRKPRKHDRPSRDSRDTGTVEASGDKTLGARAKGMFHAIERGVYRSFNGIAGLFGSGCNLLALAQKTEKDRGPSERDP